MPRSRCPRLHARERPKARDVQHGRADVSHFRQMATVLRQEVWCTSASCAGCSGSASSPSRERSSSLRVSAPVTTVAQSLCRLATVRAGRHMDSRSWMAFKRQARRVQTPRLLPGEAGAMHEAERVLREASREARAGAATGRARALPGRSRRRHRAPDTGTDRDLPQRRRPGFLRGPRVTTQPELSDVRAVTLTDGRAYPVAPKSLHFFAPNLFHFVLDGTDGVSVAGTVEPGTVGQASPPPTISEPLRGPRPPFAIDLKGRAASRRRFAYVCRTAASIRRRTSGFPRCRARSSPSAASSPRYAWN
jgi:hypothetical protein